MTRRISSLPGALDAIFLGTLSRPATRTGCMPDEGQHPKRTRREGPVSPMRRSRFKQPPFTD